MSDNSKPTQNDALSFEQWLDRVQEITDAATPGPWEAWGKREGGVWIETDYDEVLHHDRRGTGHLSEDYSWMLPADAGFIAHARTALPQAVAALRAVLDMHVKVVTDQHIDGPTAVCEPCSEDRMLAVWPCPTVAAISKALGET